MLKKFINESSLASWMKNILSVLYATWWLGSATSAMLGPIWAIYIARIGGDLLDAGIAFAIFSIVMGILTIFTGRIEDKISDKRKAIILGELVLIFGVMAYSFATTKLHVFLIQATLGVGVAILAPAWDALFSLAIRKGNESADWGFSEGGVQIAIGVGAILGGGIAEIYGFRVLFVVMASTQALAFLASLHILSKEHNPVGHTLLRNVKTLRTHKNS